MEDVLRDLLSRGIINDDFIDEMVFTRGESSSYIETDDHVAFDGLCPEVFLFDRSVVNPAIPEAGISSATVLLRSKHVLRDLEKERDGHIQGTAAWKSIDKRIRDISVPPATSSRHFCECPEYASTVPRNIGANESSSKPKRSLSQRIRFKVFIKDGFKCKYCGKTRDDGIKLEVDHITPKSKGGTDDLGNLQTACNLCNRGKADLDVID